MRERRADSTEEMGARVDAFEHTLRATITLGESLENKDWRLPTECPGWSVQDNVSHLVDIERILLGDPAQDHTPPTDLPHVGDDDLSRRNEVGVDVRRRWPPDRVLDELRAVLDRRLVELRDGRIDPAAATVTPFGATMPYAELMGFRAFDCWVHEQDIRRAVAAPGNLDSPAAKYTRRILSRSLPRVVGKSAGARPGQSVRFDVSGPMELVTQIAVEDDGRGRARDWDGEESTVTLALDWETFVRLGCGRCRPEEVVGTTVTISGDQDLGRRVVGAMAITP